MEIESRSVPAWKRVIGFFMFIAVLIVFDVISYEEVLQRTFNIALGVIAGTFIVYVAIKIYRKIKK